jgi:hypothetical protein
MASLLKWFKKEIHDVGNAIHGAEQNAGHVAGQVVQRAVNNSPIGVPVAVARNVAQPASRALSQFGNTFASGINRIDNNYNAPVIGNVGDAVGSLIKAPVPTIAHTGQILHGQNPYHGTPGQVIGQIGTDALNAASVIPVGSAIKGAQIGLRGAKGLLPQVAKSAATNAAFGAGYGATGAMQQKAPIQDVLKSAAVSGLVGGGIGTAIPLAGAGGRAGVKIAKAADKRAGAPLMAERGSVVLPAPKPPPDLVALQNEAVARSKDLYGKPSVKSKIADANNPYNTGVKIDKSYAKSIGVPLRDIPKTESLEALAEQSANSTKIAHAHLTDPASSIGGVVKKYGADTPASRDFNFYRVALRDLEHRSLNGKPIFNAKTSDLGQFVSQYEAKNPSARNEVLAINKEINGLQDKAVAIGHLDPAEVAAARKTSPNFYTPISRATPENVERASMNATSRGSIGKQSLLQEFKGSPMPVDNSFNPLTDYVKGAYGEMGRVRLAQKYAERVKAGLAPGRYTDTVENVQQRKALGQQIQEIRDSIAATTKERNKTKVDTRLASKDVVAARKTAATAKVNQGKVVTQIRGVIGKITPEGDTASAINTLSNEDHVKLFNALVEDNTKGIEGIRKKLVASVGVVGRSTDKLAAKQERTRALGDSLQSMRDTIKGLNAAKSDTRANYAEFKADPTTGLQIVSGRAEGVTFKIETTPEVAKFLQGLGEEKLNTVLKASKAAQEPFRTVFTGVLNPPFAIASATWNTVMAPVVSPQGLRIYGPRAVAESFKSFNRNTQFQKLLSENGAQKFTGNLATSAEVSTPEAIAATKNLATKTAFSLKHPIKSFHNLDVLQSKLEGAQRTGVAKAAYDARIRKSGTAEQGIADAVYAYNNVLPNFGRYSSAVRQADALVMYAGASQAGTRALMTGIARDKVGTLAKLGVVGAGLTSITAANFSNDKAQEFYSDMVDSKKGYLLDNNIIIVSPTASKDPKTGEWSGIVKVSIAPELRPINHAIWSQFRANAEGSGVPVKTYAASMFDFLTGQSRTLSNPAAQLAISLYSNRSSFNGKEIVPGDYKDLPKDQQKFSSTSKAAIEIAQATGQSPLKVDYVIRGLGLGGAAIAGIGSDKGVVGTVADTTKGKYVGAFGKSDTAKYFEDQTRIANEIPNIDDKKQFQAIHAKDSNPGVFDSPEKAAIYINRPDVLAADAKLNQANIDRGQPGNPFFAYSPEQQRTILNIKVGKYLPGQTYDKNGDSLYAVTGADSFYKDYQAKETAWFKSLGLSQDQIAKSQSPALAEGRPDNQAIQSKLDHYNTLPQGTGARKAFLAANPDVTNYFSQSADFTNKQRAAVGLAPVQSQYDAQGHYTGKSGFSRGGGTRVAKAKKVKIPSFKIARAKKFTQPKGVKVKKLAYKSAKPKKISVSKIPKIG